MIKAMILCAGVGTRLKPLTDKCSKSMLDINGKPLLEYTIDLLKKHGITEIAVNLYHNPESITKYFGDGSKLGVKIKYSLEEKLRGTAGALANFRDFFDDTFVVIYGDVFSNLDLKDMIDFHKSHKGMITIALYKVDNPTECGIVEFEENGKISRFLEKPKADKIFTDLANAGIYIIEPQIFEYIPEQEPCDFGKELFPWLLDKGVPIYGYPIEEYLIDIGTVDKYNRLKDDFTKGGFRRC